jgi:hypothetical protein
MLKKVLKNDWRRGQEFHFAILIAGLFSECFFFASVSFFKKKGYLHGQGPLVNSRGDFFG